MHLEFDEMQCKVEMTNTQRIELASSNCFQTFFNIQAQGFQMASKIHSGGVLGSQAEKKTDFNASRRPQEPFLGNPLGVQNRSKAVMEALPRRNGYRNAFWDGFGTS